MLNWMRYEWMKTGGITSGGSLVRSCGIHSDSYTSKKQNMEDLTGNVRITANFSISNRTTCRTPMQSNWTWPKLRIIQAISMTAIVGVIVYFTSIQPILKKKKVILSNPSKRFRRCLKASKCINMLKKLIFKICKTFKGSDRGRTLRTISYETFLCTQKESTL
jgi:hypothetical protein